MEASAFEVMREEARRCAYRYQAIRCDTGRWLMYSVLYLPGFPARRVLQEPRLETHVLAKIFDASCLL
jgi:hypothetical protein